MEFKIDIDYKKINEDLMAAARKIAEGILHNSMRSYFRDPSEYNGGAPGAGFTLVKQSIDAYTISEKFQSKLQALIEFHMNAALEQAVINACDRAARKATHLAMAE